MNEKKRQKPYADNKDDKEKRITASPIISDQKPYNERTPPPRPQKEENPNPSRPPAAAKPGDKRRVNKYPLRF